MDFSFFFKSIYARICITIILIFSFNCYGLSQTVDASKVKGLIVDPNIKYLAEKHIVESAEFDVFKNLMQVYLTSAIVESYENDSLVFSSADTSVRSVFKSFYYWHADTLRIVGAFGIWGGVGFVIKIHNNQASVFHMLNSDDFPSYAYNEKDSLTWTLDVPSTETKIILSEIPDSTKNQLVYGYMEFKSGNYYTGSDSMEEPEMRRRSKQRNNMKVYFKSARMRKE